MIEENSGYTAFQMYSALKLHFTSKSYDYFKYHGKTKTTKDIFMKRNDRYSFHKLSRKFNVADMQNFMISNFINDNGTWIGDMLSPDGEENYKNWKKTQQSLSYVFENDLINLLKSVDAPNKLLEVPSGCYPILLSESMAGSVKLESLLILNSIMNFFSMWNKTIDDDIVWPNYYLKCVKYIPFLDFDKTKFKNIVIKNLTH
ncbi:59 protein [uncultured Caudovirales phage]|jgi:hypothetical protein|uniref:59 protein n=1 Tax=uncultured Caudovirales phage TaxID=2100421 RepID=A0A6J5T4P6_9CAUD|nr:59 protein [uncultured Caudovirales phage]